MKKLVIVLLVAACAGAAYANPLAGLKVGTDVSVSTILTDAEIEVNPYVSYDKDIEGFNLGAKLGYDATVWSDFSSDDVFLKVYGGRDFTLADGVSLTPFAAATGYLLLPDSIDYKAKLEPGLFLTVDIFKTSLSAPMYLPIGEVEDFTLSVRGEEAVSIIGMGVRAYAEYAIKPDAEFSNVGLGVSYPLGPVGLEATGELSGFESDLDLKVTVGATYSF